ncbi:MAG: transposase [Gammaproteobacteria bacterium]|nr:MAG: transposase [Gammaproteobacteria bacterium]
MLKKQLRAYAGNGLSLDIPRDRHVTFDPRLVAKYQRRLPDFDNHIIRRIFARSEQI